MSLFLCSLPLCLLCTSGGLFNGCHYIHLLLMLQEGSFRLGNYFIILYFFIQVIYIYCKLN